MPFNIMIEKEKPLPDGEVGRSGIGPPDIAQLFELSVELRFVIASIIIARL